jgi:hypothetical protein
MPKPSAFNYADYADEIDGIRQLFQEQIDFFRGKLNLPSEAWDSIQKAAHDRAFIVAGAQKADLLNDLRAAVDKAITGGSIGQFRKDFAAAVTKSGWSGWTGEGSKAGVAWRTRVIYQTNTASSYAAGRWAQLKDPELLQVRPYWRYIHNDSVIHPRPLHQQWGQSNLTLPHDHPFWQTHFPPNGWGCRCSVQAVRAPSSTAATAPPEGWDALDPKTGAPVGIDKGWDYAPGANTQTPWATLIGQKLISLDGPVGAKMAQALQPAIQKEVLQAWQTLVQTTRQTMRATGQGALVGTVTPATVADLMARGTPLDNAAIWMRDNELLHAIRSSKSAALPDAVWEQLPTLLQTATPYWDTVNGNIVYVLDVPGTAAQTASGKASKVAININYNQKMREGESRVTVLSNFVASGGEVDAGNFKNPRYAELKK